jgi:hexokinase
MHNNMWNNLKLGSPFAAPSPPFLQKVHEQFLAPLSTTVLLALSTSLHKSYIKAAKHSHATMLPSHITTLPSGRERGQYLAVDLGGTNMRVALVRIQNNVARVENLEKWIIPESVKTGTAEAFFNWIAERIVNLAEQSELDQGEHEWKLGVTWSFPFA